jgi:flagellar basal-body rod modification protein FlgD
MDTAPVAALSAKPVTDKAATAINADFEMFLKMMTTQLQNQDPMNPIDSADYAVQLATFSGVEQQTRTNQLLESIQTQFGLMGMGQMSGWVGRQARVAAPVWVDGQPVTLSPQPAAGADRAVLSVYNAQGALVAREDVPLSSSSIDWAPVGSDGQPLAAGTYSFKLDSFAGDEKLSSRPVEAYGRITEVRGGPGGTTVVMDGGAEVPATEITALRE